LTYLEYYYIYTFLTQKKFPTDGLFSKERLNKLKFHASLYEALDLTKRPRLTIGDMLIEMENNREFNEHIFMVDAYRSSENSQRSLDSTADAYLTKALDGSRKIRRQQPYTLDPTIAPPQLFALRVRNDYIVTCN